jgi:WD40 repeat protein
VAFSPNGTTLASASDDQTIILWDVATGQPFGEPLQDHTWHVNSVAFSPDGTTLASASDDQAIILWEVATGQPIGDPLQGHTDLVNSVAFSPDGQTLASTSCGKRERETDGGAVIPPCIRGKIILWDLVSRQPIGEPLTIHTDWVTSVAFSPDGTTLASSSFDETIILWNMDWKALACRAAGRNLTAEEWRQYLGDRPYELTCPDLPPHPSAVEAGMWSEGVNQE